MMAFSKYYMTQEIQVAFIHISNGIPDHMLKFEHVNFMVRLECNGSHQLINRVSIRRVCFAVVDLLRAFLLNFIYNVSFKMSWIYLVLSV